MFSFNKKSPYLIKKLNPEENEVFLTFDDGPHREQTEFIASKLESKNWSATFFVIGQRAKENRSVLNKLIQCGHKIYSHSNDHQYFHFFQSKKNLKTWILNSIDELEQITAQKSWGFRPPAGILTPPLIEVSHELDLPILLWNHRFYDTQFLWTRKKVEDCMKTLLPGDIILLHDYLKPKLVKNFNQTFDYLLSSLENKKLTSKKILLEKKKEKKRDWSPEWN